MDCLPPILIFQYFKENPKKCSLTHLRGHPGVEFRAVKGDARAPEWRVRGGLVLRVDAPPLSSADRPLLERIPGGKLLLIDGNWARIPALLNCLKLDPPAGDPGGGPDASMPFEERLLFRSLPGNLVTAYPRRSKRHEDPSCGLATIEALAGALHILGAPGTDFLKGYHWEEQFLALNAAFFDRAAAVT